MISISDKKGFGLKIAGKPSHEVEVLEKPSHVAVLPERIPFVKPRLKVQVGHKVKVGTPVFEDKRNPDVKFLSPGGGEVVKINLGARRLVKEVVIRLDHDESYETFETLTEKALETKKKEDLINAMTAGGIWPLLRSLPFRDIANTRETLPALFINLDDQEPFQPHSAVYLEGEAELFKFGIRILRRFTENIFITAASDNLSVQNTLGDLITHTYGGDYPADDPGVQLYHTKKSPAENRSWYMNGQDVLHLARFFKFGRYPIERIIALAGSPVSERKHLKTRTGVPLKHIIQGRTGNSDNSRFIVGGMLRGYAGSIDTYMGFYENSLVMISEDKEEEPFGFIRPGFKKPSFSRTFLSFFNTSELEVDCGIHGEERACINCGYCFKVCPVDILPQFTMKCLCVDEVEEALAHGLLDCVECGLCTYVCPSKIELCDAFKKAKAAYYKEVV